MTPPKRARSPQTLATEKLVKKLQRTGELNGDMPALVENIGKLISARLGYTHRIPYADSKDTQQDCWVEVWKSLRTWDSHKSAISTTVFACCDRVVKRKQQKYMQRTVREMDCLTIQEVTGVRMM